MKPRFSIGTIAVFLVLALIFSCFPLSASAASVTTINQTAALRSIPESGMMCLTFDDGYGPTNIKRVLDSLREEGICCTFFVIGKCLKSYPDLWKQAVADGHEIAYHSMRHYSMGRWSNKKILADIEAWNKVAKEVLGEDYVIPKIARLPGGSGHRNSRILKLFNGLGYTVIGWNADTLTGVKKPRTAKKVASYVLRHAKVGTICLQHFNSVDSKSVSLYLKKLKEKGIPLGRISDALAAANIG
ncbi:MAG: polysaccharide deacetylase family protein [Candidatus Colwellbacteria bacterium]|nr:polysaccharide deacetylase family protein [Candidatus Colwellbacteria bacterium]